MNCSGHTLDPEEVHVTILDKNDKRDHAEEVRALFLEAGWIAPEDDPAFISPMLRNSFCIAGAFYRGKLIGMMRALSDGVSDAYLLDMVVLKKYRKNGIALRILDCLTGYLKTLGIDWMLCISVPEAESLYLKRGHRMAGHIPIRFDQEPVK